jgi:hypothetical protein
LAAQKVDKYDMDEEDDEGKGLLLSPYRSNLTFCKYSDPKEGDDSDQNMEDDGEDPGELGGNDQDDEMEAGNADDDDQEEDNQNGIKQAISASAKQMPNEARESLRKSREMVDSGLNQ